MSTQTKKWSTNPPERNGEYHKDLPDRYVLCQPRRNSKGYVEYAPDKIIFLGTYNQCFSMLHHIQGQSVEWALQNGGYCLLPWSERRFPDQKVMLTTHDPKETESRFKQFVLDCDACTSDIVLEDLMPATPDEVAMGLKYRYVIKWSTYKGWKVFMLMSGTPSTIPEYEKSTELNV